MEIETWFALVIQFLTSPPTSQLGLLLSLIMEVLIYVFITAYILLIFRSLYKLSKTDVLTGQQKVINGVLLVLIPIVWLLLVNTMLKPKQIVVKTKSNRSKRAKGNTSSWQSLTGGGLVQ